jgi:hypothetical protein
VTWRGSAAVVLRLRPGRYVADLAASIGAVLAVTGGPTRIAVSFLVVGLLVLGVRGAWALRKARSSAVGPTGSAVLARVVVTLGLAATFPATRAVTLAALLLVLALLAELVLAVVARAAVPFAAHLPGIQVRHRPVLPVRWVFALNTAGLVLFGLGLGAGVPAAAVAGLAAALVLTTAVALGDAALRVVARLRARRRLPDVLSSLGPTSLLHFFAPAGSEHQVLMWLPYLERLGRPYLIVLRDAATFSEISARTDRPVLLCRHASELDPVVVSSLRTVFYVNTSPRNEHMLRFLDLNHIQLNHGDSDKAASYRRVFRTFDKNFVAGQAAIDRFAQHGVKVPADAFEIVGRPQVESVVVHPGPPPQVAEGCTVMYAPTWFGYLDDSRYCSLAIGHEVVTALLQHGCTVVFRPHPWCRRRQELAHEVDRIIRLLHSDASGSGRQHVYGPAAESERTLVDCFNLSHALISDVSSVVGDFLYSEKPLAIIDTQSHVSAEHFLKEFPVARAAYVLHADSAPLELDGLLDELLVRDPLASRRHDVKQYYLGAFPPDRYADAFLDAARPYV